MNTKLKAIREQRTFLLIKPDGVARGLSGEIISRIERIGLKIIGIKMIQATKEKLSEHYPLEDMAWIERIGVKSLSGFEGTGLDPSEFLDSIEHKEIGRNISQALVHYMQSGPVIAVVVEGTQAVDMMRKVVGNTLPFKAELGTIRGDYSVDSPLVANTQNRPVHNIIHASETIEEAIKEISIWFKEDEIFSYQTAHENIMYSKHY